MRGIVSAIESDASKGLGKPRTKFKKDFSSAVSEAEKTQDVLIENSDYNDVSKEVSEYYNAVIELQEVSGLMSNVADDIVTVQQDEKQVDSLSEKILSVFSIIEDKIKKIVEKIKDIFQPLLDKVRDAIQLIKTNMIKGAKKIASLFKDFAQKLSELIAKIIEKIFGFVGWINSIAKRKGFEIDEIGLTLPTAEVEVKNLLVLAVLVVTIQTPKVSFTFKPDKKDSS